MAKKNEVMTLSEEMRRLTGIGPRWTFNEDKAKDTAGVASKEYLDAPETKKDGGIAGAGTGEKAAKSGGFSGGPGVNDKMTAAAGSDKEGGIVSTQGNSVAQAGGSKEGPGQNAKTKPVGGVSKEGGVVDKGSKPSAGVAKAGGASGEDANIEDDGLTAESVEEAATAARNERIARMRDILASFEEQMSTSPYSAE